MVSVEATYQAEETETEEGDEFLQAPASLLAM